MARLKLDSPADVRLVDSGLSVGEALAAFNATHASSGAVTSFLGKVRPDGGAKALELSRYEPLTLPGMRLLASSTIDRFLLDGLLIWHRIGVMTPSQPIVLVAAAAVHRRAAFEAVDYAMDHLKTAAWFWKREKRADGWHWIEPRDEDHADLMRWR